MKESSDERFTGTGGGAQDDVFLIEQFEDGFFLGVIGNEIFFFDVGEKGVEYRIGRNVGAWLGEASVKRKIHGLYSAKVNGWVSGRKNSDEY